MNDLTLISTGVYGEELLPQNGAPLRLVVPWKYGFKSIKSIVKIDLVDEMPTSLWMAAASNEYGFYANVNPEVDHPRWSQATERRIGEAAAAHRCSTAGRTGRRLYARHGPQRNCKEISQRRKKEKKRSLRGSSVGKDMTQHIESSTTRNASRGGCRGRDGGGCCAWPIMLWVCSRWPGCCSTSGSVCSARSRFGP
jgi:hypothetical protein